MTTSIDILYAQQWNIYSSALVAEGYQRTDLVDFSLSQLRDLYEVECLIGAVKTVTVATANGGVSIKRVA